MNLFDIDERYLSHPNYPYRKHIKNIADSFDDESHKWSALHHDLGKLYEAFQTYINPENANKQKTKHALVGALLYCAKNNFELDKNSFPIFLTILKHHGNLEDVNTMTYNNLSDEEYLLHNNPNLENGIKEVQSIIEYECNIDFDEFCEYFDVEDFVSENNLGGIDAYFQIKEVFSKLIFADKYEAIFKQKFQETKFIDSENYIEKLEKHLSQKINALSSIRNSARNDILENFKKNNKKNIFIIEAPTGIGKTFTALHLALEIVRQKRKKRIITALPMTSIIDQTFVEYSKIFNKDILLKYHHLTSSKSRNTETNEEEKDEQEYFKQKDSYLTKSWAEDNVIITTFNQVLNLFYSNKNKDLIKFWTLRDSVIVMDEVQAIPRVLLQDFTKTISFLSIQFNIDFILMSATVPEIKNFIDLNITAELLDNKYYSLEFNNRYALNFNSSIDSEDNLVKEIEKIHNNGHSVLSVVNTKKLASRLFENLKSNGEKKDVFLLSSNFIPKNRKDIINSISNKLRKGAKPILISTQVIEAGVDLDFDYGFREFSPFYSIIQTAGRVNRENRTEVKESATLTVFPEIAYSPYHQNDLLTSEVEILLSKEIRENQLHPLLTKYFKTAIDRTPKELLLFYKMQNLEFQEVIHIFNNNFMRAEDYTSPLFVEIEEGLYDDFYKSLENLYDKLMNKSLSLENKMEIKVEIKDIYKMVSQYVINVPKIEVDHFDSFYRDSEMKVCFFEEKKHYYSTQTGFNLDSELPPEQSSNFY